MACACWDLIETVFMRVFVYFNKGYWWVTCVPITPGKYPKNRQIRYKLPYPSHMKFQTAKTVFCTVHNKHVPSTLWVTLQPYAQMFLFRYTFFCRLMVQKFQSSMQNWYTTVHAFKKKNQKKRKEHLLPKARIPLPSLLQVCTPTGRTISLLCSWVTQNTGGYGRLKSNNDPKGEFSVVRWMTNSLKQVLYFGMVGSWLQSGQPHLGGRSLSHPVTIYISSSTCSLAIFRSNVTTDFIMAFNIHQRPSARN